MPAPQNDAVRVALRTLGVGSDAMDVLYAWIVATASGAITDATIGDDLTVTDDLGVGGDLAVTGDTALTGALTGATFNFTGAGVVGSLTSAGTFTPNTAEATANKLTPSAAVGLTVANNGHIPVSVFKGTVVGATAFTAAAQDADITLATLPAKTIVHGVIAQTTVAYAGLAGTIAIKVGITTGGNELLLSHDVKTATITAGVLDAELGALLAKATSETAMGSIPSFSATTAVKARLTSGTGDIGAAGVSNITTGTTIFYIFYSRIP